jgi:VCBS repeat protein
MRGLLGPLALAAAAVSAPVKGPSSPPRFDRVLLLETSAETSANVGVGDLDGNGTLDIVLAKGRHWPLVDRVLLGDGHGAFPVSHDLGVAPDRSYSARLADLDADGDLDVVLSNDAPDPKLVYRNDGHGNFDVGSTYGHPEWPTRNASIADLDGDGRPDIVVANRTGDRGGANYVCLNRGQGRFDADCLAFSQESATTITPLDLDADRIVDLAVPHRDGGQSYVYKNDGKAGFSSARRIPFGPPDARIRQAEAGDLNGDHAPDLVAIDERGGVCVYFNLRKDGFSAGVPISDAKVVPYALVLADLDLDGTIDVVVGHVESPSTIYFSDGSGRRFKPLPFGDGKGTVYGFAVGDLDGNGVPDIAAARSEAPNVVYFGARGP